MRCLAAPLLLMWCCELQRQVAARKIITDQSRGAESDRKPFLATYPGTSFMINENAMLRDKMPLAMSLASKLVWQRNVFWIEYQDVAQEGLIGYLEAARRYQTGNASLNSYAMERCNGAMLDAIRPPRSACRVHENALCELDAAEHVQGSDGSELINALALKKIYAAFDLLPDQLRDVMKLIYIDDLTMFQAGAEMGLTEGRVSQIHKKALKILRNRYGK